MKSGNEAFEPDTIDLQIISVLQEHGRIPLAKLAEQVGLSAPSVIERVKKLEDSEVITGYHTVLLKVKTHNTASLEQLIRTIRLIDGVTRTETMVVLSTHTERTQISVYQEESQEAPNGKRHRHGGGSKGAVSEARRV